MPSLLNDFSHVSTAELIREHRRLLTLAEEALASADTIEAELKKRLPPDSPLLDLMQKGRDER